MMMMMMRIVGDVGCIWVIECDCWYDDDNDENDDYNDDDDEEEDMILNVISSI